MVLGLVQGDYCRGVRVILNNVLQCESQITCSAPSCYGIIAAIARAERDGTRAETRFRLSPKRTSPFKSVGASVQSTAGSRGVLISFSNAV